MGLAVSRQTAKKFTRQPSKMQIMINSQNVSR